MKNSLELVWLVYRSMPAVAVDMRTMLDIARAAERFNRRLGVTGMLLYCERSFVQYVEGPSEAVAALRDRLRDDTRHHIMWERGEILPGARRLPELCMGYLARGAEPCADVADRAMLARAPRWSPADAPAAADLLVRLARAKYGMARDADAVTQMAQPA